MSKKQIAEAAAQRLMGWSLPGDFQPDGYITFDISQAKTATWPTGTNLLTFAQARDMFEECLPDNVQLKNEKNKFRANKDKSYKVIELSDYGKTLSKETLAFTFELCLIVSVETTTSQENYYRALVGGPSTLGWIENPEEIRENIELYHMKERIQAFDKAVWNLADRSDRKKIIKQLKKLYKMLPLGSVLSYTSPKDLDVTTAEQEIPTASEIPPAKCTAHYVIAYSVYESMLKELFKSLDMHSWLFCNEVFKQEVGFENISLVYSMKPDETIKWIVENTITNMPEGAVALQRLFAKVSEFKTEVKKQRFKSASGRVTQIFLDELTAKLLAK